MVPNIIYKKHISLRGARLDIEYKIWYIYRSGQDIDLWIIFEKMKLFSSASRGGGVSANFLPSYPGLPTFPYLPTYPPSVLASK